MRHSKKWLEAVRRASTTHGMSKTRIYRIWYNMRSRCNRPTHHNYSFYGAKGIKICERWDSSFENFLEDMGLPPTDDHTLDRIDSLGNYCKENCQWIPFLENRRKQKASRWITYQGETLSLAEWSRRLGVNRTTLERRINAYHWPIKKALSTPVRGKS